MNTSLFLAWLTASAAGLGAAFTALAAGAAWKSVVDSRKIKEEDEYLAHAVLTLERAYDALTNNRANRDLPPADRLNWLTSARLIEAYKETKSLLKNPHILRVCEGHEEHWRHQFYVSLKPLSRNHYGYYSEQQKNGDEVNLISAVIVHAFADWPAGMNDPLDKYESAGHAVRTLGVSKLWVSLRHRLAKS